MNLKSQDSQWKNDRKDDANKNRPLREDEILPKLNLDDLSTERELRGRDQQPHPVDVLKAW